MITKFYKFNENVKDFLQPKPEKDIEKLKNDIIDKIKNTVELKGRDITIDEINWAFRLNKGTYELIFDKVISVSNNGLNIITMSAIESDSDEHLIPFEEVSGEDLYLIDRAIDRAIRNDVLKLNENITSLLQPKSDDDIRNKLDKLEISERIQLIRKYKLDDSYMPSDKQLEEYFENIAPIVVIRFIKRYRMDRKYWPSDERIQDSLNNYTIGEQIEKIRGFKLDKKFMPTESEIREFYLNKENGDKKYAVICDWEDIYGWKWEQISGDPITYKEAEQIIKDHKGMKWVDDFVHKETIVSWKDYVKRLMDEKVY